MKIMRFSECLIWHSAKMPCHQSIPSNGALPVVLSLSLPAKFSPPPPLLHPDLGSRLVVARLATVRGTRMVRQAPLLPVEASAAPWRRSWTGRATEHPRPPLPLSVAAAAGLSLPLRRHRGTGGICSPHASPVRRGGGGAPAAVRPGRGSRPTGATSGGSPSPFDATADQEAPSPSCCGSSKHAIAGSTMAVVGTKSAAAAAPPSGNSGGHDGGCYSSSEQRRCRSHRRQCGSGRHWCGSRRLRCGSHLRHDDMREGGRSWWLRDGMQGQGAGQGVGVQGRWWRLGKDRGGVGRGQGSDAGQWCGRRKAWMFFFNFFKICLPSATKHMANSLPGARETTQGKEPPLLQK
jgi:hypothetical protein